MQIREFSQLAGVSVATVSRAFSGRGNVNVQTRQRILDLARQHGFTPNVHAQRLNARASAILGLVYPSDGQAIFDYYCMELAHEISREANQAGYANQLELSSDQNGKHGQIAQMLAAGAIDGVIAVVDGGENARAMQRTVHPHPCAIITNNPELVAPALGVVHIDFTPGIYRAMARLIELGHTKIGFVRGVSDETKLTAYQTSLAEHGINPSPDWVTMGTTTFHDGFRAGSDLLATGVTAILCANDVLALGAVSSCMARGARVPEDVSIIGMDDLALAAFTTPALSSIGVPRATIAKAAVELVTRLIRDAKQQQVSGPYFKPIHSRFVERASIGPVKTSRYHSPNPA